MNKKFLLSLGSIVAITLTGCKEKDYGEFTYNDSFVVIRDTLVEGQNQKAHVVFLFGQSNADGVSSNAYLEINAKETYDAYENGYDNVFINFINDGGNNSSYLGFQKCALGCGCSPDYFGPEMGIAQKMSKAYPNELTFIVKYTWGGTILKNQWLDDNGGRGMLYNSSMDLSLKCLYYLTSKGYDWKIDGICWMQGESDTYSSRPRRYYNDTVDYVGLMRHDFKSYQDEIRFIDAGIYEDGGIWKDAAKFNNSKKKFAAKSNLNVYIDPNKLELTTQNEPVGAVDYAHYDATSMVRLGRAFGEEVAK